MSIIPALAVPLVQGFDAAFTRPTFKRFVTLMTGAVLNTGRRTISNILRTLGRLAHGHPSSYHRAFSRRLWSPTTLARWASHAPGSSPGMTVWSDRSP